MPVRNVVAVPPLVVDCRARVRLLPVPDVIVMLPAPPVIVVAPVKFKAPCESVKAFVALAKVAAVPVVPVDRIKGVPATEVRVFTPPIAPVEGLNVCVVLRLKGWFPFEDDAKKAGKYEALFDTETVAPLVALVAVVVVVELSAVAAWRLATKVVLETTIGAVPVAIVDVNCWGVTNPAEVTLPWTAEPSIENEIVPLPPEVLISNPPAPVPLISDKSAAFIPALVPELLPPH